MATAKSLRRSWGLQLVLNALLERNYTIVRGGVLVIAVFVALGNLLSDISYRFLDPRIRIGARS